MIAGLHLNGLSKTEPIGRHRVPPVTGVNARGGYPLIGLLLIIVASLTPDALLSSPIMITATCSALLIGGLPHGALDLAILRRDAAQRMPSVLALYLGLAAVMALMWQIAPAVALALFLIMAMTHFAEDWSDSEHPFFALGIAIASLSAPALLHHQALSDLFVLLTGEPGAARLADTLLLVAPAAAACALLATLLLWHSGHRQSAVNAACALSAMLLLPPLTGFAIYFCLIHSPVHFRAGLSDLAPGSDVTRLTVVATFGGLAIALAALQFLPIAEPSSRWLVASFMTLSILTLPHMAVPLLLRRLGLSARQQ